MALSHAFLKCFWSLSSYTSSFTYHNPALLLNSMAPVLWLAEANPLRATHRAWIERPDQHSKWQKLLKIPIYLIHKCCSFPIQAIVLDFTCPFWACSSISVKFLGILNCLIAFQPQLGRGTLNDCSLRRNHCYSEENVSEAPKLPFPSLTSLHPIWVGWQQITAFKLTAHWAGFKFPAL